MVAVLVVNALSKQPVEQKQSTSLVGEYLASPYIVKLAEEGGTRWDWMLLMLYETEIGGDLAIRCGGLWAPT